MNKPECSDIYNRTKAVIKTAAMSMVITLAATGCGGGKAAESRITVDKEGVITNVIYDDFGEEYYELSELENMATEEISYYNSEYDSPKVTLLDSEVTEDGIVKLSMEYNSYVDYSHFNQITFFYGTVAEARENGYTVNTDLYDEYGVKLSAEDLEKSDGKHVIISSDKTKIVAPYNIAYTTRNVGIKDKKEADMSAVLDDVVVLLLTK